MIRKSIVFFQTRPTQVDAPLFRALTAAGEKLEVVFRETTQPVDLELGLAPDFGVLQTGYAWSIKTHRIPKFSHVVIEGWSHTWSWKIIVRVLLRRDLTLGVRFDTLELNHKKGVRGLASFARARLALLVSDVWHPTGNGSLEFAKKITGRSKPSVTIPYVVNRDLFVRHRKFWAAPKEVLTALVVSKLNDRESVADVISAMSGVKGWSLIVVGDGPNRSELEMLARRLDVKVTFVGYVPYESLTDFYGAADLFVHAAMNEPWGVSVEEAMLAGLPVLASERVGSANELLPRPRSEWCFEAGDIGKLAELIKGMSNPSKRELHSKSNLTRAEMRSPSEVAQRLSEWLREW